MLISCRLIYCLPFLPLFSLHTLPESGLPVHHLQTTIAPNSWFMELYTIRKQHQQQCKSIQDNQIDTEGISKGINDLIQNKFYFLCYAKEYRAELLLLQFIRRIAFRRCSSKYGYIALTRDVDIPQLNIHSSTTSSQRCNR